MRSSKMLLRALGVERAVLEDVQWEQDAGEGPPTLVLRVRPIHKFKRRCPECHRRCPGYDSGHGRRRWRLPDVGLSRAYLEADAPRVECPDHGVLVRAVPWARRGSEFTYAFEDTVAWLSVRTDKTTVSTLLRIAWRSVGAILERVAAAARARIDPFADVTRIGIDEVSYRKGHRYLTVVFDHDSGRLLWAHPGKDEATVHTFFDELGDERSKRIRLVSADAASYISNVVRSRCPNAVVCMDPFHVVQWATRAVDDVRRDLWNEHRRAPKGASAPLDSEGKKQKANKAKAIKNARWPLLKNPEDLTLAQKVKLAEVQRDHQGLYRAYLLKEQLRAVFRDSGLKARNMLDYWLTWASRSRLQPFIKLAKSIRAHRAAIDAVLEHGLSNARIEAGNNGFRLFTRLAFGFHSHEPLIALGMLKLGRLCPPLPGRS